MIRECLGLHGRHVGDRVAERALEVTFAGARQVGHEALLGQILDSVGDHFANGDASGLKTLDLPTGKDPTFELKIFLLDLPPSFNPEELGVKRFSIDQHGVSL